jgi:hypothetical protein
MSKERKRTMQFEALWAQHFGEFQERCLDLSDGSSVMLLGLRGKDYAIELPTTKVGDFLHDLRMRRGLAYVGLGSRCFGRDMGADEETEFFRSYPAEKVASDPTNIDCRFFQLTDLREFRAVAGEVREDSIIWENCCAELGPFSLRQFLVSQP